MMIGVRSLRFRDSLFAFFFHIFVVYVVQNSALAERSPLLHVTEYWLSRTSVPRVGGVRTYVRGHALTNTDERMIHCGR